MKRWAAHKIRLVLLACMVHTIVAVEDYSLLAHSVTEETSKDNEDCSYGNELLAKPVNSTD